MCVHLSVLCVLYTQIGGCIVNEGQKRSENVQQSVIPLWYKERQMERELVIGEYLA